MLEKKWRADVATSLIDSANPRQKRRRLFSCQLRGDNNSCVDVGRTCCPSYHHFLRFKMRGLVHAREVLRRSYSFTSVSCINRTPSTLGGNLDYSGGRDVEATNPRWLSTAKQRVGRCMTFGLSPEALQQSGAILQELGSNWREMLVGSEGFLTGPGRVGLDRQELAWGEMVCCPSRPELLMFPCF